MGQPLDKYKKCLFSLQEKANSKLAVVNENEKKEIANRSFKLNSKLNRNKRKISHKFGGGLKVMTEGVSSF